MKNYLRLIAFAAFALAVATSAQAMSPPPLQQPDGISRYGYRRACPTLRPVTVVVVDGSITALKPPAAVTGGTATTCALADSIDPNG